MMDFVLKMMDFPLKMMDFLLKMMDFDRFPDEHMLTKLNKESRKYVGGSDAKYVYVNTVWGVEGVTRDQLSAKIH